MTDNISVPRELLLELRDSANDCYNNEVRRYKDDRRRIIYKALVDKADELLAAAPKAVCPKCFDLTGCPSCAPAVEIEGLEVVAWQDAENPAYVTSEIRIMEEWVLDGYPIVPLCSMPKAQAVIDQQAARIKELQLDADRYRWLEANSTYGIDYRQRPELTLPIYAPDHHEGLDAAIDKAMKGEGDE